MNFNNPEFIKLYDILGLQNPIDFHLAALSKNLDVRANDFLAGTGRSTNGLVWAIHQIRSGVRQVTVKAQSLFSARDQLLSLLSRLNMPYVQENEFSYIRIIVYPLTRNSCFIFIEKP